MPCHVHAILAFSNTGKTINAVVSNGKRCIAYDLVHGLEKQNKSLILSELTATLKNTERKERKLHKVSSSKGGPNELSFKLNPNVFAADKAWGQETFGEEKIRQFGQLTFTIFFTTLESPKITSSI